MHSSVLRAAAAPPRVAAAPPWLAAAPPSPAAAPPLTVAPADFRLPAPAEVAMGPPYSAGTVLYYWPLDGWVRGTGARCSRTPRGDRTVQGAATPADSEAPDFLSPPPAPRGRIESGTPPQRRGGADRRPLQPPAAPRRQLGTATPCTPRQENRRLRRRRALEAWSGFPGRVQRLSNARLPRTGN